MTDLLKKWKCPSCGDHHIEEVMIDVVVASEIIHVPEDCTDLSYGEQTNEDGEVECYQCMSCGRLIAKTPEALVEALGGKVEEDA